ncbi:hypothetical protein QEN19_000299 [Hanseniaspora menglaensis]
MLVNKLSYSTKINLVPNGTKTFNRKIVLKNVAASTAYKTILDIEKYKEYIPYCTDSKIIKKSPINMLPKQGSLKVDFQKYTINFECDVECKEENSISKCVAIIKEGHKESLHLFEYLNTTWKVSSVSNNQNTKPLLLENSLAFKGLPLTSENSANFNKNSQEQSCEVQLELSFKFKSNLLQSVSILFGEATMTVIMNAFKKRMLQVNSINKRRFN